MRLDYYNRAITISFFNLIFISVYGIVLLLLEDKFIILSTSPFTFDFQLVFWAIVGISALSVFAISPLKQFQIQKIHNQWSWVKYHLIAICLAPIVAAILSNQGFSLLPYNIINPLNSVISVITHILTTLLLILIIWWLPPYKNIKKPRFAYGSSGIDELNIQKTIENDLESIKNLQDHVNVVAVYGGSGEGKSTYIRLLIERYSKENSILYTHISLTETSETQGFNSVFSNRWFETLSEKYPLINTLQAQVSLQPILQEVKLDFISKIIETTQHLSKGIIGTKAKIYDKKLISNSQEKPYGYVSNTIAKVFGNVNEIVESVWIIVIEEIERSPIDEILHVIEVIERFKQDGRDGLPVKLVFILAIDRKELQESITTYKKNNEKYNLVDNFLFENTKNLSMILYVPHREDQQIKYAFKLIKRLREEYPGNKDQLEELIENDKDLTYPENVLIPQRSFLEHNNAFQCALGIIIFNESVRTLERVIDDMRTYLAIVKAEDGDLYNPIRFSDLLALSYINTKYPYVIEFFRKNIKNILETEDERSRLRHSHSRLNNQNLNKDKLISELVEISKKEASEASKEVVENVLDLIALTAFPFLEYYKAASQNLADIESYKDTSSDPERLNDYLMRIKGATETSRGKNRKIERKIETAPIYLQEITNIELDSYSGFIRLKKSEDPLRMLKVAEEIYRRFSSGKIRKDPDSIPVGGRKETEISSLAYEFSFQLGNAFSTNALMSQPIILEKIKRLFRDFITNTNIATEPKYTVLNTLLNSSREGGQDSYKKLGKWLMNDKELLPEIANVIYEADLRYFSGEKDLYRNEENYFYVLYQSWSGDPKNINELNSIRRGAKKSLESHPEVIMTYWTQIPDISEKVSLSDLDLLVSYSSLEVYMPIKTLLEITEQSGILKTNKGQEIQSKYERWKDLSKDDEVYNEYEKISMGRGRDRFQTLKQILIENKIIK